MKCITKMANEYLKNKRTKPMTAEQLEELLGHIGSTDDNLHFGAIEELKALAPSLARRVLAAEKLVEALASIPLGDGHLSQLVTAYREASK